MALRRIQIQVECRTHRRFISSLASIDTRVVASFACLWVGTILTKTLVSSRIVLNVIATLLLGRHLAFILL